MVHGFWVGGRFYEENFNLNAVAVAVVAVAVVVHFNYKGYSPSSANTTTIQLTRRKAKHIPRSTVVCLSGCTI